MLRPKRWWRRTGFVRRPRDRVEQQVEPARTSSSIRWSTVNSWHELAAERVGAPAADREPAPYHGLTGDLATNLRALDRMPAPRDVDRQAWARVVGDALRLAREGWAGSAITLGWSEIDLFGIGPDDDWQFSGLAVWLNARPIAVLDRRVAIVTEGPVRSCFNRGGWGHGFDKGLPDPVPLWRFGRR